MNLKTIIKTTSGHVYINIDKNIIVLEILNDKYNQEEFITIITTIKKLLEECENKKKQYFLIFDIKNVGMYPLSCYHRLKDALEETREILRKILHSTCVIVIPNFTTPIVKFFFNIYKPVRPAYIVETYDAAYEHFEDPKNINDFKFT